MSAVEFFAGVVVGGAAGSVLSRSSARPGGGASYGVALSLSGCGSAQPETDVPQKYRVFTISENEPRQSRCAWCDDTNGLKVVGNVSHGACLFHRCWFLRESLGADHIETLYVALLCKTAGQTFGDQFWRDDV